MIARGELRLQAFGVTEPTSGSDTTAIRTTARRDGSDILVSLKDYPRDAETVIYYSCPHDEAATLAVLHLKRTGFKRIRPLSGGIGA
jgi:hypothetical protein